MADTLLFRGGSTADVNASTVQSRELVIDTDTDEIVSGPSRLRTVMVQANGRVGIGTTDPQARLDVRGSAILGSIPTRVNENYDLQVQSTGNSEIKLQAGATSTSYLAFGTTSDALATGFAVNNNDGDLQIRTGNTERVRITSSGQVGIGTSDPGEKLSIKDTTGAIINLESGTNVADLVQGINLYGRFANGVTPPLPGQLTSYIHEERQGSGAFAQTFGLSDGTNDAAERMRIDSSGNVGIGTTTPAYRLTVTEPAIEAITSKFSQGADINFELVAANGNAINTSGQEVSRFGINYRGQGWNSYLSFIRGNSSTTGSIALVTSQQEALRIDASSRLLVGTSIVPTIGGLDNAKLTVSDVAGSRINILRHNSDSTGAQLYFAKAAGDGAEIVSINDSVGRLSFFGADGVDLNSEAARIESMVDGTPGANDMPGRLVFSTTADGESSPTERMRIKSDGTINYSNVAVYADNAAAKAGGLTTGDVYRKADGTLMITF